VNNLRLPLARPEPLARGLPGNLALLTFSCLVLMGASALASPTEEIVRALTVTGTSDVTQVRPHQFVNAFNAVALRIPVRDLPVYVAAALHLRPSLAPNVVAVAIIAATRNSEAKPEALHAIIQRIVKVAIAENPELASMIAQAAASVAPELRSSILAAAIAAAPEKRNAIVNAVNARTIPFAFLTFSTGDASGFSFTAATLSPANISDVRGNATVTSPEKPPSSN
jgi:hypothetical protein